MSQTVALQRQVLELGVVSMAADKIFQFGILKKMYEYFLIEMCSSSLGLVNNLLLPTFFLLTE